MKILLVSDDSDVLASTSDTLKRDGFTVLTACEGPQALQRSQTDSERKLIVRS